MCLYICLIYILIPYIKLIYDWYGNKDINILFSDWLLELWMINYFSLSLCPFTIKRALYFSVSVPGYLIHNMNLPSWMFDSLGNLVLSTYLNDPLSSKPLISFLIASLQRFDLVQGSDGLRSSTEHSIWSLHDIYACNSSISKFFKS